MSSLCLVNKLLMREHQHSSLQAVKRDNRSYCPAVWKEEAALICLFKILYHLNNRNVTVAEASSCVLSNPSSMSCTMKVLIVLFLAGFALAAANPLFELAQVGGFGNFVDDLDFASADKPTLEEVKENLRQKLHDFLHKIREALKGGNDIKDEILNKGKEIKEKFKLLKEQLDKEGKDFLEKLVDHGRDYLKALLDKLGVKDKRAIDYHVEAIMQAEDKDGMIQKLKDRFQEVVKKVKDAIEQGKSLKDGMETLEKIRQKLKDFNIDLGDFGNEYLDQLKDKVKDYWKKLKDRLGVSKRNADIDVFGMVEELKRLIKEKFNIDKIKAFVQKYFGENSELIEALKNALKESGEERLQKLRDFVKKLVGKWFPQSEKRSVGNVFEEIRDFFEDLGIKIKNRFAKFGEWVKEEYKKSLEKSKNRLQNVKNIAKETHTDQPTQTGVRPTTVGGETTS
ncbi:hypothetical protein AVEN_159598-1 [Araneus ventricosus]|uniref:Laminin subunit alpha-2 n=1 Tax=Araneus ventricosus TaxID=182803 RepID=A0A4Y2PNB5_ARAVE|nr:hypothetical protein AVEN_159598-1 [Araneus ventricosus]